MGEAALASLDTGLALGMAEDASGVKTAAARFQTFPLSWVAGGFVVAALGLIPSLPDWLMSIRDYWNTSVRMILVMVRAVPIVWNSLSAEYERLVPIASLISTVVLVLAGIALARAVPRKAPATGGLS